MLTKKPPEYDYKNEGAYCYLSWDMEIFKKFFIGVFLLLMIEYVHPLSSHNCPFQHYPLINGNNIICKNCRFPCAAGNGLNVDCNSIRQIPQRKAPNCVACIEGKTFSNYNNSEQCLHCTTECDAAENEVETKKCTIFHDRICECKSGYYIHPNLGECAECCDCELGGTRVSTCDREKLCAAPRNDGKCIMETSKPSTLLLGLNVIKRLQSTSHGSHTGFTGLSVTPKPAHVVRSEIPTIMLSNASISPKMITIMCIVITVIFIASLVVFCQHRKTSSGKSKEDGVSALSDCALQVKVFTKSSLFSRFCKMVLAKSHTVNHTEMHNVMLLPLEEIQADLPAKPGHTVNHAEMPDGIILPCEEIQADLPAKPVYSESVIAKGAFGTIYLHEYTNNGRKIAVKRSIIKGDKTEAFLEDIEEEVKIQMDLKHERIVQVFGTDMRDDTYITFMEYMERGSIRDSISKSRPLSEVDAAKYLRQTLEGIEYIHNRGIVHRDIRGANILLTGNDNCKLAGFGLATRMQVGTEEQLMEIVGTPYWISPENMKEVGYGTKTDLWSLGCTVVEMLTKKPPWTYLKEWELLEMFQKIDSEMAQPDLPSATSVPCLKFVEQCFIMDQTKRPTAKSLLVHEFVKSPQ